MKESEQENITGIWKMLPAIGACVCDVQTVIPVGSLGQQTKEQHGWKRLHLTS